MPQVQTITLDMCRFGSPHKKPTSIMADFSLQALAKTCNMADQPHQHEPLVGTIVINGKKIFRTKLAQVYPDKLCTEWADLAATGTSQDPLAATFALTTPTSDRKRPVGQLVPWKPHNNSSQQQKPPLRATSSSARRFRHRWTSRWNLVVPWRSPSA